MTIQGLDNETERLAKKRVGCSLTACFTSKSRVGQLN